MTEQLRRVSRALISVSDKTGVVDFARALAGHGIELVSTGGTRKTLERRRAHRARRQRSHRFSRDDGRPGQDAASGGPWRLAGDARQCRARRSNARARHPADRSAGGQSLPVRSHRPRAAPILPTCIENIDIGGPAMIRAAAKNHDDVAVVVEAERLRRGARRARAARRRDDAGAAPPARRQGLCAHGGL